SFELAVDGFASGQHPHARGEFFDGFPVEPVAHTNRDPIEPAEHVQFRDREAHESVHSHGHPQHDEIEPADPPRPSRRRPVFAATPFAQIFRGGPFDFRRKRSGADARGEGLRDADDVRQELRSHSRPDGCGSRDAIARGVVPAPKLPFNFSSRPSMILWYGITTCARSLIRRFSTEWPRARVSSISFRSCAGSITTPFPMTFMERVRRTPEGSK